ncbi:MAG TPA: hypothetical protein VKG38_01725 [Solirubrobacteraceae bacterium]|nr:hypothetical protein [Solirubrobacteraceae bacterium]
MVIVEDYVPPATIERAFGQSGLAGYLATLVRGKQLPTLAELIAGATRPDQLSCSRYRGEENSPLLLLNYWIPPFPPSPSLNATIGRRPFQVRAPCGA